MALKFYNTLTRKKQIFKPLQDKRVGLYTCGPTVYNYAHIGNLRTYIFEDILRRVLEYNGYNVRHIMNITDVEDKIIRDAKKTGKTIYKFTEPYEKSFYGDLKNLNIKKDEKGYIEVNEKISPHNFSSRLANNRLSCVENMAYSPPLYSSPNCLTSYKVLP